MQQVTSKTLEKKTKILEKKQHQQQDKDTKKATNIANRPKIEKK